MTKETSNGLLVFVSLILIVGLLYGFLTIKDQRSASEKIGDAFHELVNGADKASRQLEDRTPAQKIEDAVKDTGDKLNNNSNR